MPQHYRFSTPDSASDYEDEDGHVYSVGATIGRGLSVRARQLLPKKEGLPLVVIDPVNVHRDATNECRRRIKFFSSHYAPCEPRLFQKNDSNNYRMILPMVAGEPLNRWLNFNGKVTDIKQQITFFLSLIKELQLLHAKNFVFLDLKADNVLYHPVKGQMKLIDGEHAVAKGAALPTAFHVSKDSLQQECSRSYHIAPECWITPYAPTMPSAHPSMDVYSLGMLVLKHLFYEKLDSDLEALAMSCQAKNPQHRPTLETLEARLQRLLLIKQYASFKSYSKHIPYDEPDILRYIIQRIAREFLLIRKIKLVEPFPFAEKRSYALEDQRPEEQALYLELAGQIFFDHLAKNSLADLNLQLPEDVHASIVEDLVVIQFTTQTQVQKIQSWKIDKIACAHQFACLVSQNPNLTHFTYSLVDPVQTAQHLWAHLAQQVSNVQQEHDGGVAEKEDSWGCCIA